MDRRSVMSGGIAAVALFAGPIPTALSNEQPKVFRIGYQKNGVLLVAKQQKLIEKCLERLGISVRWVEFSFGPPLLEALNSGSLEFGGSVSKVDLLRQTSIPLGVALGPDRCGLLDS